MQIKLRLLSIHDIFEFDEYFSCEVMLVETGLGEV